MAMFNLMPKPRDKEARITDLLKKLASDGISVVDAELQLARGEASRLLKQYLVSLAICVFCFVLAISAVTILAQARKLKFRHRIHQNVALCR